MAIIPTYDELEQKNKELESRFEQMEETLRVSMERNRLATSAAKVGVWDWNIKTGDFYLDPNIKAILGYADDEIPNDVEIWVKYVHPEDSKPVMEAAQACLDGKTSEYIFEHRMLHKDGSIRWILVRGKAIRDESGNAVRLIGTDADITERKQADEALRQERNRAQKLLDIAGVMFVAIDATGEVTLVNRKGGTVLGYEQKEIIGKNWFDNFLATRIKEQIKTVFNRLMAGEIEPVEYYENPVLTKIGEEKIIAWHNTILKDDEGSISGTLSSGEDITKRKRAEEVLRESEEKYRRLVEDSIDGIAIVAGIEVKFVNQAFLKMWGYESEKEIVGKPFTDLIAPKDREMMIKRGGDRENGKNVINRYKFTALRKDGTEFIAELSVSRIIYQGKVARQGLLRDITQQKLTEEELKESEERYRTLVETMSDGIGVQDENGIITYVNDRLCEMWGYSRDEIIGHSVSAFLDVANRNKLEEQLALRRKGKQESYEIEWTGNGERKVHTLMSPSPLFDVEGNFKGSFAVITDITERKQAEEALRESEEKLARSKKMESLGLLAGGVAHDLNNVLSGIVTYPELLLLDLPEGSRLRKPIETMHQSGHRAVAIVQDLLTLARGVATAKEPLNFNDLVCDYLNFPEFKKLEQFHPTVTVKTNLDSDLFNVSGSNVHIRKVLMNLVSNASEAVEGSGNVTISTANRYVDRPLKGYDDINIGEYAILSVSDDGSGIASDDLKRIFEPFYSKKVMGRSGTGLGLSVVWNVIQDHKGYIDLKSDENGTTFELYFPVTREEISAKDLSVSIEDFKGEGETLLVVDDVESQRDISCKMLDTLGYKTKAISSGEEAVEFLKEHSVDLILLDMIMDPGINGRETYERIIKIHPNQKAIIVSGFAETDEVKETQKLGAGKYIKKPLTLEEIGLAIKEELGK